MCVSKLGNRLRRASELDLARLDRLVQGLASGVASCMGACSLIRNVRGRISSPPCGGASSNPADAVQHRTESTAVSEFMGERSTRTLVRAWLLLTVVLWHASTRSIGVHLVATSYSLIHTPTLRLQLLQLHHRGKEKSNQYGKKGGAGYLTLEPTSLHPRMKRLMSRAHQMG